MALRMIEAVLPEALTPRFDAIEKDLDVLGSWREQLSEELVLFRMLVRSDRADAVIDELEGRFQGLSDFRIVIFGVEATLPRDQAAPREAEEETERAKPERARIAIVELVETLSVGATMNRNYALTVVLSTVVAAIGLLRDNLAVIIGAMVIAPLLAPNMTLAAATTLGDAGLARRALRVNLVGVSIAFAISVATGLLVPFAADGPQIAGRADATLSDLVLALAAGSAGALAFTSGVSPALVGVMVAVALLPPLVTAGLLLGAGEIGMSLRAGLLVATNVICVNLSAVATFLYQGVRPRRWWDAQRARRMVWSAAAVWLVLLALLVALISFSHR